MNDDDLHHAGMMTAVEQIVYDFRDRRAVVHLPEDCCVDMWGCIEAIKRIDPQVREIRTVSGELPDTAYVLIEGKWYAMRATLFEWQPKKQRPVLMTPGAAELRVA